MKLLHLAIFIRKRIVDGYRVAPGIAFGVAALGLAGTQAHRDAHHGTGVGCGVIIITAGQHVSAVAAFQRVVAVAAVQHIIAVAAVQFIIAFVAEQFVVAAEAPETVGCPAAGEHIVVHGTNHVLNVIGKHIPIGVAAIGRTGAQVYVHARR